MKYDFNMQLGEVMNYAETYYTHNKMIILIDSFFLREDQRFPNNFVCIDKEIENLLGQLGKPELTRFEGLCYSKWVDVNFIGIPSEFEFSKHEMFFDRISELDDSDKICYCTYNRRNLYFLQSTTEIDLSLHLLVPHLTMAPKMLEYFYSKPEIYCGQYLFEFQNNLYSYHFLHEMFMAIEYFKIRYVFDDLKLTDILKFYYPNITNKNE